MGSFFDLLAERSLLLNFSYTGIYYGSPLDLAYETGKDSMEKPLKMCIPCSWQDMDVLLGAIVCFHQYEVLLRSELQNS